jgi:regulator of sigma E protease
MAAVFVLFVVVFIHELGHFVVARWCGVSVSTFSIGFGREIAGFTDKKGTRWKLGWIPLGGYVKFMGDDNAASTTPRDISSMTPAEREGSFHHKPLWQRAAVVVAGPVANFLSAILIFAAVAYSMGTIVVPAQINVKPLNPLVLGGVKSGDRVVKVDGQPVLDAKSVAAALGKASGRAVPVDLTRDGVPLQVAVTVEPSMTNDGKAGPLADGYFEAVGDASTKGPVEIKVVPHYPAVQAGLKNGDIVQKIDGQSMVDFQQLSQTIAKAGGKELTFDVLRGGTPVAIKVTPVVNKVNDGFGGTETRGIVGVGPGADRSKLPVTYPSPLGALALGVAQTWTVVTSTLGYIGDVINSRQSADKIGGLPTIIDVSNQMAKFGLAPLVQLIGLISVSIGLLNLFPIPLLDGGHLMYYAAEAIRGKPLSDQTQEYGARIGLTIVMMLMVFALWNDRGRMFNWVTYWTSLLFS